LELSSVFSCIISSASIFLHATVTCSSYLRAVDTRTLPLILADCNVDRVYRFHTRRIGIILDRFAATSAARQRESAPSSRAGACHAASLRTIIRAELLHARLCVINACKQRALPAIHCERCAMILATLRYLPRLNCGFDKCARAHRK